MKIATILTFIAVAIAQDLGPSYGGTGPYKSYFFEVESLANHTFYQPLESGLGSKLKLPVIVWGNGGCAARESTFTANDTLAQKVGLYFRAFLSEVASYGALAIATGPAFADPLTSASPGSNTTVPSNPPNLTIIENPGALTAAVDWVYANAGKGNWAHIDETRIGVWGQSCGGLEAYAAGLNDSRIGHVGIFNSGELSEEDSLAVAGKLTKPVFYTLGGPDDIAYANGERDYTDLPAGTSAWKANHDLGHIGGFEAPNGGIPGIVGTRIVQWILRGDAKVKSWFTGEEPYSIGIKNVTYKSLDKIKVTPIQ